MKKNTFSKVQRLCGQTKIDSLYKNGSRFVVWPIRVTYLPIEDETQVLVWAPKSLFKRAVDRNALRRKMREAYRLNMSILLEINASYQIAFNYMDKTIQPYSCIEKAMKKALKRIIQSSIPHHEI